MSEIIFVAVLSGNRKRFVMLIDGEHTELPDSIGDVLGKLIQGSVTGNFDLATVGGYLNGDDSSDDEYAEYGDDERTAAAPSRALNTTTPFGGRGDRWSR